MMEDHNLNEIWKQYNYKLEQARILNLQSWVLNLQQFELIQTQKARRKLNSLIAIKTLAIALGIAWSAFLYLLAVNSLQWSKIFFVICVTAIATFTLYAVIVYVQHLIIIKTVNNSNSVIDAQEKMLRLQTSTLQVCRILFLQMPFYCFWFVTPAMLQADLAKNLLITLPVTLFFAWLAIWLFRNIKLENSHKKWFKILFGTPEWTSVVSAMSLLNEIEEFKKEIVVY